MALAGFWLGGCVMSLGDPRRRKRIEDVRCPTVKGLPDDIYQMLHHSFVDMLKMRRSIETVDALIDASRTTALESRDVLKRARRWCLISGTMPLPPEAVSSLRCIVRCSPVTAKNLPAGDGWVA